MRRTLKFGRKRFTPLHDRPPSSDRHIAVPDGKELWPFQRASVDYALSRPHCLVADQPGLGKTPIIAVSSFAMKGDEEKARASGCDGYVTKPYSPMQLLRMIRGFLPDNG